MSTLVPFPVLPDATFRECAGPSDAAAVASIHQSRLAVDSVDPTDSYEEYVDEPRAARWFSRAAADGSLPRITVIERDGAVAGAGYIERWKEEDGTNVYLLGGTIRPEARGHGLGSALLAWQEKEAVALADRDHPGEKREFAANASTTETDATKLVVEAGYRAEYVVAELRLDLDAFEAARSKSRGLPPGLLRGVPEPSDFRAIAETVRIAFAKEYAEGRFAEVVDPEEYAAGLAGEGRDRTLWRIARESSGIPDAGRIAVVVLPDLKDGVAWISEVATLPEWRRRGAARALLVDAVSGLLGRGVRDVRLCTMEQFRTRAIDLYESAGFRRHKDFPRYRKAAPPPDRGA